MIGNIEDMNTYYLGPFPPAYGGVTIKNQNLYIALRDNIQIDKIDFSEIKRKNIQEAIKLIKALLNPNSRFVVGVAGKNTRKYFSKLLYLLNRKAMEKSIIMIMGGSAANDIAEDSEFTKYVSTYKKIYVETTGMIDRLKQVGLTNVGYYPNGRFTPMHLNAKESSDSNKFKCVFFSLIQPEKGVDIIIETARQLPKIEFVFYGVIDEKYKAEFETCCTELNNVSYKGIFSGSAEEVYSELQQYDILLLPKRGKAEGVPGVLIEAKIAGVPAIVSNHNYNAEIVTDQYDGIVMQELTANCLKRSICSLVTNPTMQKNMSMNAQIAAEKYYIEKYIDELVEEVGGKDDQK